MHDVVIIGGGHNGLVCSAYLAMAGFKVVVLDQRPVVGGAAVTEEFSPGFFNSVASYTVSLLNPKIIHDLDLAGHGLRIVERPISNFLPLGDGGFLKVGGGQTKREVAKFSARDADRLDDYQTSLATVADVLRASVLETPPNVVEGSPFAAIAELLKAGRVAKRIRALGLDLQRDFLDLIASSAGDFLDGWFESAPIKAAFGFDSVVGNYASPYTQGSAYLLLHHSFGEVNGKKAVWGHAIGGMGAITQAMAKATVAHSAEIRLSTRVRQVLVENGRAIGVETDKGETIRAKAIAAGINPKLLYLHLIDSRALPEGFRDGKMALWFGHVSHECRAFRTAGLHRFARTRMRGASRLGHYHRPEPHLYGAGLFRRAIVRLVALSYRGVGHSFYTRRHARAPWTARSEPVLPACRAQTARRLLMGRPP